MRKEKYFFLPITYKGKKVQVIKELVIKKTNLNLTSIDGGQLFKAIYLLKKILAVAKSWVHVSIPQSFVAAPFSCS